MNMAILRTAALLGLLTAILLAIGFLFAGIGGMTIALIFALLINFFTYWFSDKIVLSMYRAKPTNDKKLNSIVEKVAKEAGIPKPKVYIVPTDSPNAFATGRSPSHSSIAVTQGLLDRLDDDEIEGVLSHELSHVKNRDTLVSAIAATVAGAISYLAQIAWLGMSSRDRENGNILLFPLLILAPIAAMLVQLSISRGREFFADYTGAMISRKPLALASALEKISSYVDRNPMKGSSATSHLWIVNPFKGSSFASLFMTHPSTDERVRRLKELARKIK
jgi:heat shock protein HtpX